MASLTIIQQLVSAIILLTCMCFLVTRGSIDSSNVRLMGSNLTCYVKPNATKQPCPGLPCDTLSNYVHNNSLRQKCLGSGASMTFLPGVHRLLDSIVIENVSNLALMGEPSITNSLHGWLSEPSSHIDCSVLKNNVSFTTNGTFIFKNVANLTFKDLMLVGCGGFRNTGLGPHAALFFNHIFNLTIVNIIVQGSSGFGLCATNVFGTNLISNSSFRDNDGHTIHPEYNGGNMRLCFQDCANYRSQVTITSSIFFYGRSDRRESYAAGLVISIINCSDINIEIESSKFSYNKANIGGNMAVTLTNISSTFLHPVSIQNCYIEGGTAFRGGGLYVSLENVMVHEDHQSNNTVLLHIKNTTVIRNYAWGIAGGLYVTHSESASLFPKPMEILIENCTFQYNIKGYHSYPGGIAAHLSTFGSAGYQAHVLPRLAYTFRNCSFEDSHNSADDWISASVFVVQESSVAFINCTFSYNKCTSLAGDRSSLLFHGNITFMKNHAKNGAGLVLCERSVMYLFPNTTVWFYDNHVWNTGGAIHIEQECMQAIPPCFFQLSSSIAANPGTLLPTVQIIMINNTALSAGTAVYGGSVEYCYFIEKLPLEYQNVLVVFSQIFNITSQSKHDTSPVSSDPLGVCLCNASGMCNETIHNVSMNNIYPGETFGVSVVLLGEMSGTVPGLLKTHLRYGSSHSFLNPTDSLQNVPKGICTTLSFTVFSDRSNEILELQPQQPSYTKKHYEHPWVILNFLHCPIGFAHSNLTHKCDCIGAIKNYGMTCDITNQTIRRVSPLWIGYATSGNTTSILLCKHCPLNYCKSGHIDLLVTNTTILQNPQCAFDREGVLCGQCRGNQSLMLGSSQCAHCSNFYLLLLVAFAVAGVLLVFMLFLCNITVSEGTLSGLIFYANVVQLNNSTFFPPTPKQEAVKVLTGISSVFIAWLNLDLGIEMCFFHGMDMYSRTWLQFAFPFYIWGIAGFLVLLSRRYNFIARLLGKNAVKVLATLFLISYTKLQRAVMAVITFSVITIHPGASQRLVWLFDGNLDYIYGKHVPLFLFAILVGLISLPYTIALFFITCLQRFSGYRVLHYISKLKPLFDAYTGPYTDKCRFWPGLLLVARVVLLIVYAFNITGDPRVNLVMSTCVCMVLLVLAWLYRGGVYKLWSLDVLEAFFISNLGILSATTAYFQSYKWERNAYAYTSIGLSMLGFVGIVFYHIHRAIRASQQFNCSNIAFPNHFSRSSRHPMNQDELEPNVTVASRDVDRSRELEDVDSAEILESPPPFVHRHLDRCREPLLETASYHVN